MRGHVLADKVLLAGSFTGWENGALPMLSTDSGWIARVKLKPGKYWYKFIVDDGWTTDTDNMLSENDGRGNTNSVYYKANVMFTLRRYDNAGRYMYQAALTTGGLPELAMTKTPMGWQLPLYLADGTYTYRFVVDGRWMTDPDNADKFPNQFQ